MAQTFAERLKGLREAAGLSQAELAARAGMNQFGVAKLEQGKRQPAFATVQALARALNVSVSVFEDTIASEQPAPPPAAPAPPAEKAPEPPPEQPAKKPPRRKKP